jgi:hypothetical protein
MGGITNGGTGGGMESLGYALSDSHDPWNEFLPLNRDMAAKIGTAGGNDLATVSFGFPTAEHTNHSTITVSDRFPATESTVPSIPGEALANDDTAATKKLMSFIENLSQVKLIFPEDRMEHSEGEING